MVSFTAFISTDTGEKTGDIMKTALMELTSIETMDINGVMTISVPVQILLQMCIEALIHFQNLKHKLSEISC